MPKRRTRGGKKSRRKGGNFATTMGCKEGQVLASFARCPLTSRISARYMTTGKCCIDKSSGSYFFGGKIKKRRRATRKRRKKFKKGTKSKTHKGKDFETRKTSKYYNSKRMKRRTGRRRRLAPIFPWA